MPGSFSFDSQSTTNYVKFSKFNPVTLVYDYYNVSGQVGYTYREFHGGSNYSFIGTFSLWQSIQIILQMSFRLLMVNSGLTNTFKYKQMKIYRIYFLFWF